MTSDIRYTHLYRVLRPEEDPTNEIVAKSPSSDVSVEDHVGHGGLSTRYISTCSNEATARNFAYLGISHHDQSCPKKIITIDVEKLKRDNSAVRFIDLTDYCVLSTHIPDAYSKARHWASSWNEVLIIGKIPSSSISRIDEIS